MTGVHRVLVLSAALAAPVACLAGQPCAAPSPASPALPADLVAQATHANAYPSFCSIPPTPRDVRDAGAFKSAVVDTRLAGVRLQRQGAENTFSLSGTDDFAASAASQAAPPPPMTTPQDADTDAFIKEMRAKATPPPRPR
jgi:hypothetical protein